ncbi:isopropylmalate/homocitrate/citramalate synthase [Neobacillus niacini]|uniref:hypothetical protein n=1 Tax=Neobacillus niacini TaxID=86668 RepID=UPI002789BF78|nr:hypothetical protein [Neobacillus niacini]MDQ1004926.1 isopropylmalate/homocitrate/citramalate synthase [Neobacillus niacini]
MSKDYRKTLDIAGDTPVTIHLHDNRGLGLANAYSTYQAGVRIFEMVRYRFKF